LRFDDRPGETRPWHASWWLRGGFEGGCAGVLAWSLSVRQLEGLADGGLGVVQRSVWWCPVDSGSHVVGDGPAVPGMVAQWQGWPHRAGGDGGDALHHPHVTTSSWTGARLMVVCLSRVSPSCFEGCGMEEGREWVAQCHGVTSATPYNTGTALGMATQRRVGRTTPGSNSEVVSGGWHSGDSLLTRVPAVYRSIYCPSCGSRRDATG
jgi:hypothetical protein